MQSVTYALFGGSFDPPHIGHKEIIKKALDIKDVDCIIVVPTYLNPFKDSFNLNPDIRYELAKESFDNLGCVEFSTYEIEQKRSVYTIETYKELSKTKNIKFIIIGSDNLKSITKWKEFDYLNNKITWIVATRGKNLPKNIPLKSYKIINLDIDVSSSEIRANKKLDFIDKKIKSQIIKHYKLKED